MEAPGNKARMQAMAITKGATLSLLKNVFKSPYPIQLLPSLIGRSLGFHDHKAGVHIKGHSTAP